MLSKLDPLVRGAGRLAMRLAPQLEGPLRRGRGLYAHAYVTTVAKRHGLRHEAGFDPYGLHWVSPDRIRRVTEPMTISRFRRVGLVEDGDWDCRDERFRETDVFRAFEAHFEDGRPWAETAFFERVLDRIEAGGAPWGCESRADLEERCDRLDDLYETIREEGYRTQRELLAGEADDPVGGRRVAHHSRLLNDEIAVDVARDGELLFADGRNRLAIAIVLGLDRVPVMILRRHERWQAVRDEVARRRRRGESLPSFVRAHPDLPAGEPSAKHDSEAPSASELATSWGQRHEAKQGLEARQELEAKRDLEAKRKLERVQRRAQPERRNERPNSGPERTKNR